MSDLQVLLENNIRWSSDIKAKDPGFFQKLAQQQSPEFLWIGCSDSRVPANDIVGLLPGELFVHRNIANTVVHTDLNCLSVLHYAVSALKVKHIIVCGHYGCGGVQAALGCRQLGLVDNWLRNIRDVYYNRRAELIHIKDEKERLNRMCEINVKQQVANVSYTNIVQNAWDEGQELSIHGWIYDINDGLIRDLTPTINSVDQIPEQYRSSKLL